MPDAPNDDQQAFLIEAMIKSASTGDYFRITGEQIDALIADRQALLEVIALEKAIQNELHRSIF